MIEDVLRYMNILMLFMGEPMGELCIKMY